MAWINTYKMLLCGALFLPGYAIADVAGIDTRDPVGDLNAPSVKAGDFPGAIKLPGKDISLAIGGFVKTVAINDSYAEQMGADFLPAYLGTSRPDESGQFSIDSTLSRIFFDARAPIPTGHVRAYIEYDLNKDNNGTLGVKLRHAYGAWYTNTGTLIAGQTWSTFMDTSILPEGLTEPTVSGAIFQRQPIISWTQPLNQSFTYYAAVEDPSSNDVFSDQPSLGTTSVPDIILGIRYAQADVWHLRLNGILRKLQLTVNDIDYNNTGYGFALTGGVNLSDRDRFVFGGVYGEGVGRYLLGIPSTAGGAVNVIDQTSELRKNSGILAAYRHQWNASYRSTAMAGYAKADPLSWQTGDTFENSSYFAVNLMWQVQTYLTMGIEYSYGDRENVDGSELTNTRVAFGIQVF